MRSSTRHLLVQREADRFAERHRLRRRLRPAGSPGSSTTGSGPVTCRSTDSGCGPGAASACVGGGAHDLAWLRRGSASASLGVSTPASIELLLEHGDRVVLALRPRARPRTRYFFWSSESECEYGRVDERVHQARPRAGAHVRDRVRTLAAHLEVVAAVHLHDVQAADAAHHLRDRRRAPGRSNAPRSRSRCRRRRRAPGGAGGTRCSATPRTRPPTSRPRRATRT